MTAYQLFRGLTGVDGELLAAVEPAMAMEPKELMVDWISTLEMEKVAL